MNEAFFRVLFYSIELAGVCLFLGMMWLAGLEYLRRKGLWDVPEWLKNMKEGNQK